MRAFEPIFVCCIDDPSFVLSAYDFTTALALPLLCCCVDARSRLGTVAECLCSQKLSCAHKFDAHSCFHKRCVMFSSFTVNVSFLTVVSKAFFFYLGAETHVQNWEPDHQRDILRYNIY